MSLRRRFARGSTWLIVGTSADNVIQFIIFAILARLLTLLELGIVTFTMLFVDISRIFVSGGLPAAIVQRADWDHHVASVCFTYNALMAIIVSALFAFFGSALLEHFYGPGSGLVAVALSFVLLIDSVKMIHVAKLKREMKYRSIALRSSFAGLFSGAVAIVLALNGAGVWSLVFQRLTNQIVLTWLSWRAAQWRPSLSLDLKALAQVLPFGVRVTVARGLEILNLRMPDLLVGAIVGPVGVATYRVGTRALDTLKRTIIHPFQDASFSALSRLEKFPAIVAAFIRLIRTVTTATFPIFFGSTVIAVEMTVLLFSEKYAESGHIFAIMSLAGIPSTLTVFAASALMASGQPRVSSVSNAMLVVLNLAFIIPLALKFGTVGAALGNLAAMSMIAPVVVILLKKRLGLRIRELIAAVFPPVLISAGMAAILWAIKLYALPPMGNLAKVAILMPAGILIYVAMFALWGRTHLRELIIDIQPILPRAVSLRLAKLAPRI